MKISNFALAATLSTLAGILPAQAQETYKLGYLVDASGPTQGIFSPALAGFKLYIDNVNASGGINGKSIDLQVRDVQVDTQRATVAAQELASSGALAIVGLSLSSTHMPVYAIMNREGVPVVAGYTTNVGAVLPPNAAPGFYGVGIAWELNGEVAAQLARLAVPDGKKFVSVGFESPGGFVVCESAKAGAAAVGFEDIDCVMVPLQQRDFRAIAERVSSLQPDVVVNYTCRGRTLTFLSALAATDYSGSVFSSECTGEDELREVLKASPKFKMYEFMRFVPPGLGSGPQVDALEAAAKAAGINDVLVFHSAGWALGVVMEDALRRCGEACDTKTLNAVLAQTSVDLGGLTGVPVQFTENDHYGPTAHRLFELQLNGEFTAVGDWLEISGTPQYYKAKQ